MVHWPFYSSFELWMIELFACSFCLYFRVKINHKGYFFCPAVSYHLPLRNRPGCPTLFSCEYHRVAAFCIWFYMSSLNDNNTVVQYKLLFCHIENVISCCLLWIQAERHDKHLLTSTILSFLFNLNCWSLLVINQRDNAYCFVHTLFFGLNSESALRNKMYNTYVY